MMKPLRTLPSAFTATLDAYGAHADELIEALTCTEPSVAVRANVAKGASWSGGDRVPWLSTGIYLAERPTFALDPMWHAGMYYVQDASSMTITKIAASFIDRYLSNTPLRALDACAAPGGKTIALYEALPKGSLLLANEYDSRRAAILCENVAKFGVPDIIISRGDTRAFKDLEDAFDFILVDAPCSGEGMMRKEAAAIDQWSPALVAQCASLQREIVNNCYAALRPGGVMIYSTCTFNRHEDEDILAYLVDELGAEVLPLYAADFPGAVGPTVGSHPCLHFLPGAVRGEGLFISAVRRPGEWSPDTAEGHDKKSRRKPERNGGSKKPPIPAAESFVAEHLSEPERFVVIEREGNAVAVDKRHAGFVDMVGRRLSLLRFGLPLYTIKGRDLLPAWELAVSTALRPETFPQITLSPADALPYLHGSSLSDVPAGTPTGYALVTCRGVPLGFVKNIGRRANNLYPDAYRLRLDPGIGITSLPHLVI